MYSWLFWSDSNFMVFNHLLDPHLYEVVSLLWRRLFRAEEQLCTVVCVAAVPKWGLFNELTLNNVTTALDLLPLRLTMATAGTNTSTKQSRARKFLLFCWRRDDRAAQRRPESDLLLHVRGCKITSARPHLRFNRSKTSFPWGLISLFSQVLTPVQIKVNMPPKFLTSHWHLYSLKSRYSRVWCSCEKFRFEGGNGQKLLVMNEFRLIIYQLSTN